MVNTNPLRGQLCYAHRCVLYARVAVRHRGGLRWGAATKAGMGGPGVTGCKVFPLLVRAESETFTEESGRVRGHACVGDVCGGLALHEEVDGWRRCDARMVDVRLKQLCAYVLQEVCMI